MIDTEESDYPKNKIINHESSNSFNITNDDKTFNRLKKLQMLIKKESALKELCK